MMTQRDSFSRMQEDRTLSVLFFLIFGAVIVGLIFVFRYYFWPFLFAFLLYLALRPLYDRIAGLLRSRSAASFVMILVLILLIIIPLLFIVIAAVDQIVHLYHVVESEIEAGILEKIYAIHFVQRVLGIFNIDPDNAMTKLAEALKGLSVSALSNAQALISYPLNFMINFFFLVLMLFFLFKDGYRIEPVLYKILPFPDDIEKRVVDRLKEVVRVLLMGNIFIMILQGAMVGFGLAGVGIPVAVLGGSLAAILSLIPVIGTSMVWLPAVIYLAAIGAYVKAMLLGGWCLGWYLALENIVKPKLFGKKLNFHPVLFFFLLLGSIQAFGLPGVFIGPILLTLYYSLWEIYKMFRIYDRFNLADSSTAKENEDQPASS